MRNRKKQNRQGLDSCFFCVEGHFEGDGTKNLLVLQPVYKYFKIVACDFKVTT